jgi:hypothetical protein
MSSTLKRDTSVRGWGINGQGISLLVKRVEARLNLSGDLKLSARNFSSDILAQEHTFVKVVCAIYNRKSGRGGRPRLTRGGKP